MNRPSVRSLSVIIGLSCLIASSISVAANIYVANEGRSIVLAGEIEAGDFKDLFNLGAGASVIILNSEGGDVAEAMRIGRYLRAFKFAAVVPEEAVCASACVLVYVGAVDRLPRGKIGLHRPYFDRSIFGDLSADEAQQALNRAGKEVETYLVEMEAPASFIDEMMKTRSSSMEMLTGAELNEYGIGLRSPAFEEWIIARCGDLTNQELSDLSSGEGSTGYRNWLLEKADTIADCKWSSREEEHRKKVQESLEIYMSCLEGEGKALDESERFCLNKVLAHSY